MVASASTLDATATLTPRQARAAALLGAGRTPTETAADPAVNVNVRTLGRWRVLPAFGAAVMDARRQVWRDSLDALRGALPEAVAVLKAELAGGEDRLKAAVALLRAAGLGGAAVPLDPDAADMAARVEALEAALMAKPGGNGNGRLTR